MKFESKLSLLFGSTPTIKVLDVLINNYPLDYSKIQLCEVSSIQYNTLMNFWENWEKLGILKCRFGNRYSLDKNNKVVKLLFQIYRNLR